MSSRLVEEAPPPPAAAAAAAGGNNENGSNNDEKVSDQKSTNWQKSDREFMLVVVTFLAAVAFQAGINPPGGVWQDDKIPRYEAGKSIMATEHPSQFITFIVGVTVCMLASMVQLLVLINELPFNKLSVSRNFLITAFGFGMSNMILAYWSAVRALTPEPLMQSITSTLASTLAFAVVTLAILMWIQRKGVC